MTLPRGFGWRLAASAAVLAALVWFDPPAEPRLRLCGFYWLTGRPCPLCGLTRALCALAKGHWRDALHFHALSPLALALLAGLFWEIPLRARLWSAAIAVFSAYGILRALAVV